MEHQDLYTKCFQNISFKIKQKDEQLHKEHDKKSFISFKCCYITDRDGIDLRNRKL